MKTKSKAILAFLTIFILGGVSGYLINDSIVNKDRYSNSERYEREGNERWGDRSFDSDEERAEHRRLMRQRAKNRLSTQLDLSENQKGQFFNLLENYHTEIMDSIRVLKSTENRFIQEHYDEFKSDLSDLLNDQQINRLDSFFHPDSVRHNRMQHMRNR